MGAHSRTAAFKRALHLLPLLGGAAGLYTAPAWADSVYPGCATPPQQYGHVYKATPATLEASLAQAVGGDIIYLTTGSYGQLTLTPYTKLGAWKFSYGQFLTIAAAPGQSPVFAGVAIAGASHIILKGLIITGARPMLPPAEATWPQYLVTINSSNNIIFENNTVASQLTDWPWASEPTQMISGQIPLTYQYVPSDGLGAYQSYCVSISSNLFYNLMNGIQVFGDQIGNDGKYFLLSANHIDNFAWDAIDHGVSNIIIQQNLITNNHDICDPAASCPHSDAIQGWNYNHMTVTNNSVNINANTIIAQATAGLPLPGVHMNGITIFDGFWNNVTISNNAIVLLDSGHGITTTGTHSLKIVNNTVAGADPAFAPRINYGGVSHEGGVSSSVTVRNNIAPAFGAYAANAGSNQIVGQSIVADHNLAMSSNSSILSYPAALSPSRVFVQFDTTGKTYDLRLNTSTVNNPAIGAGSAVYAPPANIVGVARTAPINVGAY